MNAADKARAVAHYGAMAAQAQALGGIALSLHIGQRVRLNDHQGRRVTGVVRTLTVEDNALMATVGLDQPIVIPPIGGFGETHIHVQHVPAHELVPFDEREEVIAEMLAALQALVDREFTYFGGGMVGASKSITRDEVLAARAAIARATGAAA